ncbi:MAG: hypothetical protein LBT00_14960 [Spirochaetaceae bacterium]|nr:hypothetical protein [Spirochaetaceae bacterium]
MLRRRQMPPPRNDNGAPVIASGPTSLRTRRLKQSRVWASPGWIASSSANAASSQ